MPLTTPASALGKRYLPHITDICAHLSLVAARYRRLSPLLVLVWFRLGHTLARLDRLATRWHHGRLRPAPRPGRRRARRPAPRNYPAEAWLPRRTPAGHAWLIRLHQPMAQFIPRIQALLDDPEIVALCAAAPQAGRLLRPLCRMFAITPPAHLAGPGAPREAKPPKPRPRNPAPPPFAEHSPNVWPFVPHRLRLRVQRLRRPKPPD
ncbi:MAG: hypothetical protein ABS99_00215 [Acetobacteraceae bacterium SCN 69-10]|nr:hypothetical protein [Rhodospirillales bacterium]ODU62571.1 MAG: hypothetical protein ABS99_00215 [Acetobacteraceae bacterium SCN 69-10]OJY73063.1 MAG: hypothetical protein BGP12_08085 [Rhodospirillales bacterium 70-18]